MPKTGFCVNIKCRPAPSVFFFPIPACNWANSRSPAKLTPFGFVTKVTSENFEINCVCLAIKPEQAAFGKQPEDC